MTPRGKLLLIGLLLLAGTGCSAGPALESGPFLRSAWDEDVTPLLTPTDFPPTPTETLLPPAELPTPESTLTVQGTWSGTSTYPSESEPGYDFQVSYDNSLWALSQDEMGLPALIHRQIPYCQITPTAGRGTPRGWSSDNQKQTIGELLFEVYTVSQAGEVRYLNYFGGDERVLTGFQVSFQDQRESCLQASEAILATLSSTPAPLPTPTLSPTSTETPWPTPTEAETPIP